MKLFPQSADVLLGGEEPSEGDVLVQTSLVSFLEPAAWRSFTHAIS